MKFLRDNWFMFGVLIVMIWGILDDDCDHAATGWYWYVLPFIVFLVVFLFLTWKRRKDK